ncbi:hypothetical protein EYF80_063174 [Liparis tanakae]|uniref:Uncharacterized protein n=1 Tax=Liparis tanakae TaxID=230148 RepID=A0A4Z2EDR0_9TELE|nr:hypothetical protein EYF80_063174 [Liparis tanakae]
MKSNLTVPPLQQRAGNRTFREDLSLWRERLQHNNNHNNNNHNHHNNHNNNNNHNNDIEDPELSSSVEASSRPVAPPGGGINSFVNQIPDEVCVEGFTD